MTMKRLDTMLLLVIAVVGCSGVSPTSTATSRGPTVTPPPALVLFPTPPSGWRIEATPTYQIALPGNWQNIPLDPAALRVRISAVQAANPDLARALQGVLDSGQNEQLEFYAVDPNAAALVTSVTIAHTLPAGAVRSEDLAAQDAQAITKQIPGAKVVSTQPLVSVNGIDAALVQYDLPVKSLNGQPYTLRGIQFLFLVSPQDLYVVTITGNSQDPNLGPQAEMIGKSFVAVRR